MRYPGG